MSYHGSAIGALIVECVGNDPEKVSEALEEHSAFHDWVSRKEIHGDTVHLEINEEISWRFNDDLEAFAKDIMERFPGAYMHGALYMRTENDCPYRWEIDRYGEVHDSDDCDWLVNYSCEDIRRIEKWASENCKESYIRYE